MISFWIVEKRQIKELYLIYLMVDLKIYFEFMVLYAPNIGQKKKKKKL